MTFPWEEKGMKKARKGRILDFLKRGGKGMLSCGKEKENGTENYGTSERVPTARKLSERK